ncbi:tetratricopeptide repeat protein [Streptomyces sp. NPDC004838]
MASSSQASRAVPNLVFRRLRGPRSPGEFAAAVRKAAREIGEKVSCDARYIGRVEAGEIRCPNYAYERVFLHMFPGLALTDLGFTARERVRGGGRGRGAVPPPASKALGITDGDGDEESDVLRRAFMTGGSAAVATASLGSGLGSLLSAGPGSGSGSGSPADPPRGSVPARRRVGENEVAAVEEAVRRIRLLDDRHGADGLYRLAAQPLRAAYALLDSGVTAHRATSERLHSGAGELAISVGWLAHDSGRVQDARSHYAEALATARVSGDPALEAHAFSNASFLARDTGRHREAVRAAQAAQRAARDLGSPRQLALLSLREAGGWAGLGDRTGCEQSLGRAHAYFGKGAADADPEWMSFFGEPELEFLQAQCWVTLREWPRATRHARRAATLQDRRFTRNLALYHAELMTSLAHGGVPDEAASAGQRVLDLLEGVRSSRIQSMLASAARVLERHREVAGVAEFLSRRGKSAGRA